MISRLQPNDISSPDETHLRMRKILFTSEFYSRMKRVEFYPAVKFSLKENL